MSNKKKLDVFAKRKSVIANIEIRKRRMLRDTNEDSYSFSKNSKSTSDNVMSDTETSDDEVKSVMICRNERTESGSKQSNVKKRRGNKTYGQKVFINELHCDSTNALTRLENNDNTIKDLSKDKDNGESLLLHGDTSTNMLQEIITDSCRTSDALEVAQDCHFFSLNRNAGDHEDIDLQHKKIIESHATETLCNKEDNDILPQPDDTSSDLKQTTDINISNFTYLTKDKDCDEILPLNNAETNKKQKKPNDNLDSTDLPGDTTNLQENIDINTSKIMDPEKKTKENETIYLNNDLNPNLQQNMNFESSKTPTLCNASINENDEILPLQDNTNQQHKKYDESSGIKTLRVDKETVDTTPSFSSEFRENVQPETNLENDTLSGNKENNEVDSPNVLENIGFDLQQDITDSEFNETFTDHTEAETSYNSQRVVNVIRNDVNLSQKSLDIPWQPEVDKDINLDAEQLLHNNDSKKQRKRLAKSAFKSSCIDFNSGNEDFSSGSSDIWTPCESEAVTDDEGKRKRKRQNKKKSNEKQTKQSSIENNKELSRKKVPRVNKRKSERALKQRGRAHETRTGHLKEGKTLKTNPCELGKCARGCHEISDERRQCIFNHFWGLDEQRRRDWVVQHSKLGSIKRKKTKADTSRRNKTYVYFINEGEGQRQVCQQFLINTLDVTQKYLIYTIEHAIEGMAQVDQRSFNTPLKYTEESRKYARDFLDKLPAVSSHYCRRQSKKLYLSQDLKNIANLYRLYIESCKSVNIEKISEMMFRKIFNEEYNLSFHVPKKDKCVQCVKSENDKELTETEQNSLKIHLEEKKASYRRFNVHQNLQTEDTVTTSFDLQKVLNTPYGESMLLYYSRKYSMYNLAFYESQTQNGFCYLWGESDAKRGSNEIATCITKYLENVDERGKKHVLLYCDACAGQNKNKIVLTALHHFLKTSQNIQVIQINFLLPGHSYMPVDSMHAVIEREVKKLIVWSPSQWPTYIEAARKNPFPYKVEVMEYSDILNWNELADIFFKGNPVKNFQKIRIVTLKKKNLNFVEVKYSMKDNTETLTVELKQNPKTRKGKGKGKGKNKVIDKSNCSQDVDNYQLRPLYSNKQSISQQKYDDLRKLCLNGTIPKRFHTEFLSLPTTLTTRDRLPETDEEELSTNDDEANNSLDD